MTKSQSLSTADISSVFRLLSDMRELREDRERQQVWAVDVMVKLIGASYGFSVSFRDFRPEGQTRIARLNHGTVQEPIHMAFLSEWGNAHPLSEDPLVAGTIDATGATHVNTLRDIEAQMPIDDFVVTQLFLKPVNVRDVLVTFYRNPEFAVDGFSFHRRGNHPVYTQREKQIVELFIDELHDLKRRGLIDPPDFTDRIPENLQRLIPHLIGGASQRTIAEEMGLTYQTVRSYTRDLYEHLGVNRREAFLEHLRKQSRGLWSDR